MRGGSLTRFRPDEQSGRGFVRDLLTATAKDAAKSALKSGWQGLKTNTSFGLPLNIAAGKRGLKTGAKRAVKRKALGLLDTGSKRARKRLTDIFGS